MQHVLLVLLDAVKILIQEMITGHLDQAEWSERQTVFVPKVKIQDDAW